MPDPQHTASHRPTDHQKGKAAIFVVTIVVALILVVFVGRNFWHATKDSEAQNTSSPAAIET